MMFASWLMVVAIAMIAVTTISHISNSLGNIDERNIYEDNISGIRDDRLGLKAALEYLKEGDTLVVWKLDRLGRSLPHLLKIVTDLQKRNIGFKSLTGNMGTSTAHGELIFNLSVRSSLDF